MNIRHNHQTILRTCTAVTLPLVLMIGCAEKEPVALQRDSIHSVVAGFVFAPGDSGSMVKLNRPASSASQPAAPVIYFATDEDNVAVQDIDTLKQHAGFLLAHERFVLHVNGHADERGTPRHNADLSARRAQQTAALLTSFGVPHVQLSVASFGSSMPVGDPHRWSENRRVELLYADGYDDDATLSER